MNLSKKPKIKILINLAGKLYRMLRGWRFALTPSYTIYQGHLKRKVLGVESVCLLCGEKVKGVFTPYLPNHVPRGCCEKMLDVEQMVEFASKHRSSTLLLVIDKETADGMFDNPYLGFVPLGMNSPCVKEFLVFDMAVFERKEQLTDYEKLELYL